MVDLPQQVVDEDRAPEVGLWVLQEPQLLQRELQDAAAVLLQYQVLPTQKVEPSQTLQKQTCCCTQKHVGHDKT